MKQIQYKGLNELRRVCSLTLRWKMHLLRYLTLDRGSTGSSQGYYCVCPFPVPILPIGRWGYLLGLGGLTLGLFHKMLTILSRAFRKLQILYFCQALVPSPVPLDPNLNPKQSKIQIQVQLGLGWHYNHIGHPPPPTTFNHEGVL